MRNSRTQWRILSILLILSESRDRINRIDSIFIIPFLAFLVLVPPSGAQSTATLSGMITGPDGSPAPGVRVQLGWGSGGGFFTTNSAGVYSCAGIPIGTSLNVLVRAPVELRLAQRNFRVWPVTGDIVKDLKLEAGNVLRGRVVLPPGQAPGGVRWMDARPLSQTLPSDEWRGEGVDLSNCLFETVLVPDVYELLIQGGPNCFLPRTAVDLRDGDALDVVVPFATEFGNPYDFPPPDAGKIAVGPPDVHGEATVTGAAGAVQPLMLMLVANLQAYRQDVLVSKTDGSFEAKLFAPPGSSLIIKYGPLFPANYVWFGVEGGVGSGTPLLPGTIINVPHQQAASGPLTPFAAVGAVGSVTDDMQDKPNYVSTNWTLQGTMGPVVVPGQWSRVLTGKYEGQDLPGLYRGGLNWTHPALGDLDGDGDLDLLLGEREGHVVFYRNAGTASVPNWRFETGEYAGVATSSWAYPAVGDLNLDGLLDLAVGTGDGQVAMYLNKGTKKSADWPAYPDYTLACRQSAAPALADLDGDGDLDLVAGGWGDSLLFFRNDRSGTKSNWPQVSASFANIKLASAQNLQPHFVDLDNDKDLDLLLGFGTQLRWYRNGGSKTNPSFTLVTDDFLGIRGSSALTPAAGDWDGDGDPDIITGEHWGTLRFLRNDNYTSWTEQNYDFPFERGGDSAPALADWDGDGDLDLLFGQSWGQVVRYSNAGTNTQADWRPEPILLNIPWGNHPHPYPTFADVDGDGDQDLFIGEGSWEGPGAAGNVRYYRNDGNRFGPNWNLVTEKFLGLDVGGFAAPVFIDIDADDDLDLFIGCEAGTLTFVPNTGSSKSPIWGTPVTDYGSIDVGENSAPAFLDLDQDGDLDMLIGSRNGSLAFVRNKGTARQPQWELVATEYPGIDIGEYSTPVAVDLNGDGKKDLLIGDGDGGLNLFLYQGPGTPPPAGRYLPGDVCHVKSTLRIYNAGIVSTFDPKAVTVTANLGLLQLFDQAGRPRLADDHFMSDWLTPSGFPIQRPDRPILWTNTSTSAGALSYVTDGCLEGTLELSFRLPDGLKPGTYRPVIAFMFQGLPTRQDWAAAYIVPSGIHPMEAGLPVLRVGDPAPPHLIWRLFMEDFNLGLRGPGAREDANDFQLASDIVTQGAPYVLEPIDPRSGRLIDYRLEPYLPAMSKTDRRVPCAPLIPFALPGGQLDVSIRLPDGSTRRVGPASFRQSTIQSHTIRSGNEVNNGTVQLNDVYSLTTSEDNFWFNFSNHGHHVITMTGNVKDIWGNSYEGGGTYDVWVAHALDIDAGVLPLTPLAVGDSFNPTIRVSPGVPADIELKVTLYPDSDPAQAISRTFKGRANAFGEFAPPDAPFSLSRPGEYRVDLSASYWSPTGEVYMGTATWGGVVMTPPAQAQLIAHGRRGVDSLQYIPNHWFVSKRDLTYPVGAISHTLNPYYNGDIAWTRSADEASGGNALIMGASVQDTVGAIEATIRSRFNRYWFQLSAPGTVDERFAKAEIPMFSCARTQQPAQLNRDNLEQIAYSYRSSQRPGLRVREVVAEDGDNGGYWRLDTLYDDQPGVGILGDLPNDYKFQYVGVVYRDLINGHKEYLGQGTGWIFIPDDDALGNRVMPPFAGPGNGGWTTEGGPLFKLEDKDVHIFILPTGIQPGAVLEVGDTLRFAGHIMPTLDSQVEFTVTAPAGARYPGGGKANSVGYYYRPEDDFIVNEPGVWSVDVRVWHDGMCSGGKTVPPFPSGDILGSKEGRFWFYVTPAGARRLTVTAPTLGMLPIRQTGSQVVSPILVTGTIPSGTENAVVDYTISMPGFILAQGKANMSAGGYSLVFDPARLAKDHPNLDLVGRDVPNAPGLSDTFTISLLLTGRRGYELVFRANSITIQGEQVLYENDPAPGPRPTRRSGR